MKLLKLLTLSLMLTLSTKTVFGQYTYRTPSGEIVLDKNAESKALQLIVDRKAILLELEAKQLEINYLKNKEMESFRLTQALMESNEKLQAKTLALSKKVDVQNENIGQLKAEIDRTRKNLRFFQITTAVTGGIILLIFVMAVS